MRDIDVVLTNLLSHWRIKEQCICSATVRQITQILIFGLIRTTEMNTGHKDDKRWYDNNNLTQHIWKFIAKLDLETDNKYILYLISTAIHRIYQLDLCSWIYIENVVF